VSLDITSIEKVSGGKSSEKKEEDTGEALDRLKNEVESAEEDKAENYEEE
jgi:hypothetical protein